MEKLGERVFYSKAADRHFFKVRTGYFEIIFYLVICWFLFYLNVYWLLAVTVLLSIIDYCAYEELEFNSITKQLVKKSGFFNFKPYDQQILLFDDITFVLCSKYSLDGEAAVKDLYAIYVLNKDQKSFEFYSTNEKQLIDKLSERLKMIYPFKWENRI